MTWQYNLLKYLDGLDLGGTHSGWVEHNTSNGWENLCHYWTFANPELFIRLVQAIIEYDKKSPTHHYYVGIGTCCWPVTKGPCHKRKHYFSIHRYPKRPGQK